MDIAIVKERDGLVRGLKTFYYVWKGDKPPEDYSSLKPIRESVSPWINYVWWDSPAPGVPGEFFAILWWGFVEVDRPGYYRFYVVTDDGSRVWIDGKLVIDAWRDQPPTVYISNPVYLKKGYHNLKYFFYNRYSFSEAVLGWMSIDGEASIIPKEKLYHCLSNEVFFTNIPDNYVVELLPAEAEIKRCVSVSNVCRVKLDENEIPLEAYIRVVSNDGKIILETKEKTIIWGGDEFRIVKLEQTGP